MQKLVDDVAAFHLAMGQPVCTVPKVPATDRVMLRAKLISQEFDETMRALIDDDLPELADGIADLIYVLVGTAVEYGIPLAKVWDAVQSSNMAKLGPDGKAIKDASGKVLKPEGWKPPDIGAILQDHGW